MGGDHYEDNNRSVQSGWSIKSLITQEARIAVLSPWLLFGSLLSAISVINLLGVSFCWPLLNWLPTKLNWLSSTVWPAIFRADLNPESSNAITILFVVLSTLLRVITNRGESIFGLVWKVQDEQLNQAEFRQQGVERLLISLSILVYFAIAFIGSIVAIVIGVYFAEHFRPGALSSIISTSLASLFVLLFSILMPRALFALLGVSLTLLAVGLMSCISW